MGCTNRKILGAERSAVKQSVAYVDEIARFPLDARSKESCNAQAARSVEGSWRRCTRCIGTSQSERYASRFEHSKNTCDSSCTG